MMTKVVPFSYVSDLLYDLAYYMDEIEKQTALERVAEILHGDPTIIHTVCQVEDMKEYMFFGEKIISKICEIFKIGRLKELGNAKVTYDAYHGIIKSLSMFRNEFPLPFLVKYKLTRMEQLYTLFKKRSTILTPLQNCILKYFKFLNNRKDKNITTKLQGLLGKRFKLNFVGSVLRNEYIRDIDVVYIGSLDSIVSELNKKGIIIETIRRGKDRYSGIIKVYSDIIKLDIFACEMDNFITTFFAYSGTELFVRYLRSVAKKKNLVLNNDGLFLLKDHKKIHISTDREIFKILGLKYMTKKNRKL